MIVVQSPATRWAGIAWLVIGAVFFYVYRRRVVHEPLTETVRAPILVGPAVALEYRNILVPMGPDRESEEAVDLACRLAAERRATVVAITVIEVPLAQAARRRRFPRRSTAQTCCSTRRRGSATPSASR